MSNPVIRKDSSGSDDSTESKSSKRSITRKLTGLLHDKPAKGNQVVIYIRSEDTLSLKDSADVEAQKAYLLNEFDVPRSIWNSDKDIYIPKRDKHAHGTGHEPQNCSECRYAATLDLDSMGPLFKLKRVTGTVRKGYVFENPLRSRPTTPVAPAA